MGNYNIGLIGLAVMGENLALNMESKGFSVAVFNRTTEKTKQFAETRAKGKNINPAYTIEDFVNALEVPRKVFLMVKAGEAVDSMITLVKPLLSKGDLIIDGGNSFFKDTERRAVSLEKDGLLYIGTGVSGGEEGALKGPCIMPGGQPEAYKLVKDILKKISAQVDDGSCCAYIGPRGAGHYVKMVHNGIEYGDMQLIAEAYDLLQLSLGLSAPEIGDIMAEWKKGDLDSYLMDITVEVLRETDTDTKKPLVDVILDKAGQKGTGKWTSQNAFDIGVAIPTITSAVEARILSAFKDERVFASTVLKTPKRKLQTAKKDKIISATRDALLASKIMSYAQGMGLLRAASTEYKYDLNFSEIAQIWKGGCIIRAKLLDMVKSAFRKNPDLPNLLVSKKFAKIVNKLQSKWRFAVKVAKSLHIPYLTTCASLDYFDSYKSARLPANLIQGQRDYFGAHTYERTDKPGSFHTAWIER